MKLDEDPLQINMNMIELKRKKVLIQPCQAELTKGKKVIIREKRTEDDQAQKSRNWSMEEERERQATILFKRHLQHPHG
jgi:hypothetical protein